MIYKNIKERHEHKIQILSNIIEELETELKELKIKASSKSMAHICMQDDADRYYIELEEYRKLKSEVHKDIEKVWMYDSSFSLTPNEDIKERSELIEKVFYKIANEWID
jgi:hypothetical protein